MAGHAEESASDTALQSEATAATFSRISRNPLSLQPIRPPMSRRTLRDAKSNSQILSLLGWPIQGTLDIHFQNGFGFVQLTGIKDNKDSLRVGDYPLYYMLIYVPQSSNMIPSKAQLRYYFTTFTHVYKSTVNSFAEWQLEYLRI